MSPHPDITSVTTWDAFRQHWRGPHNFLMGGECSPLAFKFPPVDRVIAELSADAEARITCGIRGNTLDLADYSTHFRSLSIEKAMQEPFSLAHFKLSRFDAPGKFLHGFGVQVLERWQKAITAAGFTFDRCNPIIFISGLKSATNYHMDFSHVLAWQIYGTKNFCGLRDPDRWAPRPVRVNYKPGTGEFQRPADLSADDLHCLRMPPGAALWNVLLTPHEVLGEGDQVAMSVNLSHGGLRLHGQLSPNEAELEESRRAQSEQASVPVKGTY
jgi:hypothetical protein